ncbi:uncharacterized protein LOC120303953 [Crotalus tigris]|uniref:uncharacterized protein LOC120303953 n=1 Tax=Crotalus tigris TaxID=88082 RepID=UPI00192F4C27|nr:uncharacterized protein LOC120303953 [Crotalus tigris]
MEVLGLRQRGRPIREYVREFQRVAGRLRAWPERLLVYHFCNGLDKDLRQACIVRGVPCRFQDWFRVVTELHAGLQEFRLVAADSSIPRQVGDQSKEPGRQPPTLSPPVSAPPNKGTFRCFRCNRPGRRVAQCLVPAGQGTSATQGGLGATPRRTPDRSRALRQAERENPHRPSGEATPPAQAAPDILLEEYDNMDPEEDPMREPW